MVTFVEGHELTTEVCCNCGMLFAMPSDYQRRRRNDHEWFYCPSGHKQHYTGVTEEQRLRNEVERQRQMREAAEARARAEKQRLTQVARAHSRMRKRVANGVCPCCNRSFGNLREHMRTQHPDFGDAKTLRALRTAFGMSQSDVAREVGISTAQISNYERENPIGEHSRRRIQSWLEAHSLTGHTS